MTKSTFIKWNGPIAVAMLALLYLACTGANTDGEPAQTRFSNPPTSVVAPDTGAPPDTNTGAGTVRVHPTRTSLAAPPPAQPTAAAEPCLAGHGDAPPCEPRDVSGFDIFQPKLSGAMFDYRIPTVEEALEQGFQRLGASPTHLAIRGIPVANSVRCAWQGTALTNRQREGTIRLLLGYPAAAVLPAATELQTKFDAIVAVMAPEYQAAIRTNFKHLVDGGVLEDDRVMTCYVDYSVSEYLLGNGANTLTVAYDQLGKTTCT